MPRNRQTYSAARVTSSKIGAKKIYKSVAKFKYTNKYTNVLKIQKKKRCHTKVLLVSQGVEAGATKCRWRRLKVRKWNRQSWKIKCYKIKIHKSVTKYKIHKSFTKFYMEK